MPDATLIWPLAIILAGAALCAGYGRSPYRERLSAPALGWLLSVFPLAAFVLLVQRLSHLQAGMVYTWQIDWMPSLKLTAALYLDSLGALFALLITFIGALVILYAGQYFKAKTGVWRFFFYLLLFMGAMLGLVMAGDVLTLFICWEATSIVSFLLVAYATHDPSARQGAFKALLITGGGGIPLLIGLLFVAHAVGDTRWHVILGSGDVMRLSPAYLLILALVALGAFTKSAQFPFHVWLPDAMSAPTPASAYLHSATMVKAGIYLMARLNPVLGGTESWFWLLSAAGLATMLTGAVIGLKKHDLKAILAYSTICQLGILMTMIGMDMAISFKALVIGILAHALYKSALFLVVGIVDHETGTRDIRRLGGLRRSMPVSFAIASIAALSMAGLPPLFGFLAKETLLASAAHPSLPAPVAWAFVLATVVAGAFMLAMAANLVCETFLGNPKDPAITGHEAPWPMWLAPALPTLLSLVLGQLPGPKQEAALLANAAAAAHGAPVKVSLALWTGLNVPLLLSVVAVTAGSVLFFYRRQAIAALTAMGLRANMNRLFDLAVQGIDSAAQIALGLQSGKVRVYLWVILTGTVALVMAFNGPSWPVAGAAPSLPTFSYAGELVILRLGALFLIGGTSLACVLLAKDMHAILAFGASGLGVAVLMALEPAPDLALVQIVVDILLVIILVLALSRLPREKLQRIQLLNIQRGRGGVVRDALVAGALGITVAVMTLAALLSRPRDRLLAAYFEANAKPAVGSKSIVGAVLTDFRGMDTLIEIAVYGIAGLGIYTLLCLAAAGFASEGRWIEPGMPDSDAPAGSLGIGGKRTSPLIRGLAWLALPLAMTIGVCDLLYGHDKPGDGFTAGVIVSIGIGFWYMAFGYDETRERLRWLRPSALIGWGILMALISGFGSMAVTGTFFANADFGRMMGLPLPAGLHLTSSFIFEVAIGLTVVGSTTHMLNTLGHPGGEETKWKC